MIQAIAGVAPPEVREVTVAIVWPSIAAMSMGRCLGRLYSIKAGFYFFRVGNLLALASIPLALPLYFFKVLPFVGSRIRLTNRRIIVERGLSGKIVIKIGVNPLNPRNPRSYPRQLHYFFCFSKFP